MNTLDVNDDQQLETALARAVKAFTAPADLKRSLRAELFTREPEKPAADFTIPPQRIRLRRRWAVALAAALLIVAGITMSWSDTDLVPVAYAELAVALEKTNEAEWIHYDEGEREFWLSFRPYRAYHVSSAGARGWDRSTNRQYHYDRATNTLTIEHMGLPSDQEMLGSFAAFIRQKISGLHEEGREVRKGTEKFLGKTATVYVVTGFRSNEGGKDAVLKYFIDPATDRVLGIEGSAGSGLSSWLKVRIVVDYPAEGPRDVYAVGVPRDARIIDHTPSPEILALVDKIERGSDEEPSRFCQISATVCEQFSREYPPNLGIRVEVTYAKDGRLRRERYGERRNADYEQSLRDLAAFRKEVLAGGLGVLEAWLKERKPRQILLSDSTSGEVKTYRLNQKGEIMRESTVLQVVARSLARPWGHPLIPLAGVSKVIADSNGPWGELVGIEAGGARWYFNPQRHYLCEKFVTKTEEKRILEYGRSDDGRWFAKSARESTHNGRDTNLVINFRDDRRVMAPEMFDEAGITAEDLSADDLAN